MSMARGYAVFANGGYLVTPYFISRIAIIATDAPGMARWRKQLFRAIARNSADPVPYFGLPVDRTTVMGQHIGL